MRALLDTNAFLWAVSQPPDVEGAESLLHDDQAELLVSAVVAWELATKSGNGRLELEVELPFFFRAGVASLNATQIAVTHEHALAVERLPKHHTDPFDRLLVAQAQLLGVPIVSSDRTIARYDVEVLSPN